jgi:hypothetical protein
VQKHGRNRNCRRLLMKMELWRQRLARSVIVLGVLLPVWESAELDAQLRGRPGAAFVAAGASVLDVASLDGALAAQGYPTFGRTALALGGGAYRVLPGGLMIGLEGHGLSLGEEAHDGRSVSLAGGYGTFRVGYLLAEAGRGRVYPSVGIGGGGLTLMVGSRPSSESFDDVLANPNRQAMLARPALVLDLGAGAEVMPGGGARGAILGLRAGYLFAPAHGAWRQEGFVVSGGPEASLAGPYVRATLGSGRRR